MVIVWLAVCLVLIAIELHNVGFFAVFVAAGAAVAAGIAVFAPSALALQVGVAVAVSVVGVLGLRPYVSRVFEHRASDFAIRGVHGGLVGARGVTLDEVSPGSVGHIRLVGETWLAVTRSPVPIPPSTAVLVTEVEGTTLTVTPAAQEWS